MLVLIVEHGNCNEHGVLHFGTSFCFVHVSLTNSFFATNRIATVCFLL
jgi:hypothetical protein